MGDYLRFKSLKINHKNKWVQGRVYMIILGPLGKPPRPPWASVGAAKYAVFTVPWTSPLGPPERPPWAACPPGVYRYLII